MKKHLTADIIIDASFLGADGNLTYNRMDRALEITMHGMIFNANHMSGLTLANKIKNAIEKSAIQHDIDWMMINEIRLYCCAGGFGGIFSVANVLASHLEKPVRAYTTRYSPAGTFGGYENKMKYFQPKRKNVMIDGVHKVLYFTSEHIILPTRRALR